MIILNTIIHYPFIQ